MIIMKSIVLAGMLALAGGTVVSLNLPFTGIAYASPTADAKWSEPVPTNFG